MMLAATTASAQAPSAKDECLSCHLQLSGPTGAAAAVFRDDIHMTVGFTCAACHGGDPSVSDKTQAKNPSAGYIGTPTGERIVTTCARCHSDAAFMRRYAPRQRVDQASEYAASVHGQLLARGDTRVATCANCHGAHGIRRVNDARAPVFPTNVAQTCATCHSNPVRMKSSTRYDGSPLTFTQYADYQKSVHYEALTKRNDLSAPTCNDCHGSHGAAPPGVGAVSNVCGTCHAVFAERFETTVHREIFDRGCVECHGNHAVSSSSDEMLGTGKAAVCVSCHSDGDQGFATAAAMRSGIDRLKLALDRQAAMVAELKNAGMEMSEQELAIGEARTKLTLARTEIHTIDPKRVDPVLAEGMKIALSVEEAAGRAGADLRFRRRGLMASLGAILLMVLALALKIRQLDRSRPVMTDRHGRAGPP